MILRCMPPETLTSDVSELERTGAAATEVALPMNMILSQLPSGKVEMTVEELVPHLPPGFLQPVEAIATQLHTVVSLPLMDVVMRIPPDLLALRPDQKEVDSAVVNMADPFTEEILREQAEASRRQAGANIIEESQAPHEEFVPSAPSKSIAPPRRPAVEPLSPSRTAATTLASPAIPTNKPTPPGLAPMRQPASPLPPAATAPALPPPQARTPTGQIPTPSRMSAPLPPRQTPSPFATSSVPPPVAASAPVPPVPRHTGPIPAPPPPRHTTSLPTVSRRTGTLASLSQSLTGAAKAAAAAAAASGAASFIIDKVEAKAATPAPVPTPVEPEPEPVVEPAAPEPTAAESLVEENGVASAPAPAATPDAGKDDLQRLAALAMAQLGDAEDGKETEVAEEKPAFPEPEIAATEPEPEAPVAVAPVIEPPAPEPIRAPEPEPISVAKVEEPISVPEPIRAPEPVAVAPVEEPIRAPAPEPIRAPEAVVTAPVNEPIRAPAPEPAHAHGVDGSSAAVAFNLNTCTAEDLVHHIPGVSLTLAAAIIAHREKIGSYSKLEDLLKVPGMNRQAYTNLTGEAPPEAKPQLSVNDLLGFPAEQNLSLKDVTDRILCWPDVTGCLLSQSSGLSLVGSAPAGLDKAAIVAFAPRMFEAINKSYSEVSGEETDVLIIPSSGTSFHLFRSKDLYLIIMTRLPLMPERHVKVARFVLTGLSNRKE